MPIGFKRRRIMRNFFETQKILFTFHFRHLKKRFYLSKDLRRFRRFLKQNFCLGTRKIILKYYFLVNWNLLYKLPPNILVESIYIRLDNLRIDLQKLPMNFSVQKKLNNINTEMKWLEDKEGIDLP